MGLFSLFITLFISLAVIGLNLIRRKYSSAPTLAILTIVLFTYFCSTLPALATPNMAALAARDRAISERQQALEEDLKITPGGGHYSGLEYAKRTAAQENPVSDETIKSSIEDYVSDNVIVAVANGSVRFSGTVKNKETARHIVEQTKEIPGVHEVTFNFGLEN